MANKYTYSRTIKTIAGDETFSFEGAASFDEAKKEVDKGVRDRQLELRSTPGPIVRGTGGPGVATPPTTATPAPATLNPSGNETIKSADATN